MTRTISALALSSAVQMCGGGGADSSEVTPSGYSCKDYQIIVDVEVLIGRECTAASECAQVAFESEAACESESMLLNSDFDATYLFEMVDEAESYGCALELPLNDDCGATEPSCAGGACSWR